MASISPLHTTTITSSSSSISTTSKIPSSLLAKPSQLCIPRCRDRHATRKISCKVAKNDDDQNHKTNSSEGNVTKVDRRNMLIGLGGLYGAATSTLIGGVPSSFAAPIATPEMTSCEPADLPRNVGSLNCCPPMATNIVDFKLPPVPNTLRVRQPAHLVDDEYVQKFSRALSLMKELPDSDPRSFTQQGNVHCAYCNGSYSQVGFPNLDLQVHGSWLFMPFHRFYLHFFERILGKLIDDPTFAIPFWNWDTPAGMQMPAIYADPSSPLYDPRRDETHQPPAVVDLNYDGVDNTGVTENELISANLTVMYRQMVSNSRTARLFFGQPYRAGNRFPTGGGSVENIPHGPVHVWTGDPNQPNFEDMGNFYSAGRDPLFYAHHTNVDRMWSLWKTLGGTNRQEFTDPDWLNASFIFYDENAQAVRVKVQDCLDTKQLGYTYQDVDLPWLRSQPTPRTARLRTTMFSSKPKEAMAMDSGVARKIVKPVKFPKPLKSVIRTNVRRPKKNRTKKEKEAEEEVLVVEVEVRKDKYVKFDVYINDEDDVPSRKTRVKTEYAGSFVNVPHKHDSKHGDHESGKMMMKTTLRLGLTDLIDALGADDDDGVVVSLMPRSGKDVIVINDVKIEYAS